MLKPAQLPVPQEKFQQAFGLSWKDALEKVILYYNLSNGISSINRSVFNLLLFIAKGLVFNAMDACKHLGLDAEGLDKFWGPAKKVKFGGGFYCGLVEVIFLMRMSSYYYEHLASFHVSFLIPNRFRARRLSTFSTASSCR